MGDPQTAHPPLEAHCSGRTRQGSRIRQTWGPSSLAGRVPCRPALLLTCSAASGSRCGSSSGTVNWIFRGLLSGSMVGRWPLARAAAGKAAGLGAGAGALPLRSAPLRPGPSPARSAPGSWLRAPSSRPRGLCSRLLAPHRPSQPPPSPGPLALTPSWLRRWRRGSPPRGRASGVWPAPVLVDSPGACASVPGSSGQGGVWRAAMENFSKPGRV